MSEQLGEESAREFQRNLKWLIGLRVLVVTVLLGSSLLFSIAYSGRYPTVPIFYLLIGVTYLLTILYSLALKHLATLRLQATLQIMADVFLETGLILGTGAAESPFRLLYAISIIAASLLLGRRGSLWAAASASLLYSIVVLGDFGGWFGVVSQEGQGLGEMIFLMAYHVAAFFAVALLSSSLTTRLHYLGKQLERQEVGLQHLQRFHEYIVQSVGSGLVTADLSWKFTSMNRAGMEITGYRNEELRGRMWWELFDDPQMQRYYQDPRRIMASERFDIKTRHRHGSDLYIGLTLSLLRDERGEVSGILGVFQDLTQVQRLEEEMRRKVQLAALGEMAAGMAHEIRNPLASLSGVVQVLRTELAPKGENRHLMDIALREMDRLDSIISTFLTSTRPIALQLSQCNLMSLLEETVKLLYNHSDYRTSIAVHIESNEPAVWLTADPNQLRQVIWNLLLNAVQAMSGGGVMTIRLTKQTMPESVELQVCDNGKGITPKEIRQIFTPFFTTRHGGSGLGLPIVHRIIEAHQGRLTVESREGQGTTVTVTLPVHAGELTELELSQ